MGRCKTYSPMLLALITVGYSRQILGVLCGGYGDEALWIWSKDIFLSPRPSLHLGSGQQKPHVLRHVASRPGI
jgi:hypothetical protein